MTLRKSRSFFLVLVGLCQYSGADVTVSPPSRQVEVCSGQTFSAQCPPGQVIMIDHASYGRMRSGPCKVTNIALGCSADAILYVESFCAGRRSCNLSVSDDIRFTLNHGCGEDMLGYLELEYYCQPVYEGSKNACRNREPDIIQISSGYIASVVTMETGKGALICHWIIRVSGTQTINLTLVDYGVWSNTKDQNPSPTCTIYALIYIANAPEPITLCSGRSRQRALVTLNGKKDIRIVMTNSSAQLPYYLIHFEVRETRACPEYEPPSPQETITSFSNDTIHIQCPRGSPERTLTLKCTHGQWISESGRKDCGITPDSSSTTVVVPASARVTAGVGQGIVVITLAVALSICLLIIAVGIVCYLKRKPRRSNEAIRSKPLDKPNIIYSMQTEKLMTDDYLVPTDNPYDTLNNETSTGIPLPMRQQYPSPGYLTLISGDGNYTDVIGTTTPTVADDQPYDTNANEHHENRNYYNVIEPTADENRTDGGAAGYQSLQQRYGNLQTVETENVRKVYEKLRPEDETCRASGDLRSE